MQVPVAQRPVTVHATQSLLVAPVHSAHDESHCLHVGVTVEGSSLWSTAYYPLVLQILRGPIFKWHLTGFTESPEIVRGAGAHAGARVASTAKPATEVRRAPWFRDTPAKLA